MPSVALPGSSNNVSPDWICIAPYKTKAENVGGGQPRGVFVKSSDGNIVAYESIKGCARSMGVSPDLIYAHINKYWWKNNPKKIQFADSLEVFNSFESVTTSIAVETRKPKTKASKKKNYYKKRERKYKLIARYNDGRTVYCYSMADASRRTGVDSETIAKYTNKKWDKYNKHGIQFVTISKEA